MKTKKFFSGNVAYTTPSGRMHMGHGLGHITTDVAVRFSALLNEQEPFFPFGMHSTGKDLIRIIKQLSGEVNLENNLQRYNISPTERARILNCEHLDQQVGELVEIYRGQYRAVLTKLGTCIDFDSFFSSHQSENHRFTQWTIRKLIEKGLIVTTNAARPYCPDCNDIKAVEKDLSEVVAEGKVDWDTLRIEGGQLIGGKFFCRLHGNTQITVCDRNEKAIDYGNSEVQERAIALAANMSVWPSKYAADIPEIIRTRKAKPFEREPNEMVGAPSPINPSKRVEALADSNIYMEFFPFARSLNTGQLGLENLTDSLFDFVLLNKGSLEETARTSGLAPEKIQALKKQVTERYPIDISVIGLEHKEVHLPFSLFTHAAVLPEDFFFREYLVTGHITNRGEKMSKSKGNVVYLDEVLRDITERGLIEGVSREASLDSLRYFLSYYQYLGKDFNWDNDIFFSVGVSGTRKFVQGVLDHEQVVKSSEGKRNYDQKDKWLSTISHRAIEDYLGFMTQRNSRDAMILAVDTMGRSLRDYVTSTDQVNANLVRNYVSTQLKMVNPVMPRIARELFQRLFAEEIRGLPVINPAQIFPEDYEIEQHRRLGKEYVSSLTRAMAAQLSKLFGQKKIKPGDYVAISLPAEYTHQIASAMPLTVFRGARPTFSVDTTLREPKIEPI